ncbi:MAG: hypothetical protein ABI837_16555 [Acidobacteriota bacterium]
MAHPGHELRVMGWLQKVKPRVFALTDGSGPEERSRLDLTRVLLESAGVARSEGFFGKITDRQAYKAILECDSGLLLSFVEALAAELIELQIGAIVADAAEGYNPVHDLCRLIVGAGCSLAACAGLKVTHYEYAVVGPPKSYEYDEHVAYDLDDEELERKLSIARSLTPLRDEVEQLLARFGEDSFRRELFRPVKDWTSMLTDPPLYERIGEERVTRGRYERVIRYREHMLPLQTRLLALVGSLT